VVSVMESITSVHDLDEARSQPRAFVFLYVNWAIQARHSIIVVRKFLEAWQAARPTSPIPAYLVDLSDQTGEVWEAVRAWIRLEGEPVDRLTYGGYGSLLWVTSGSITAYSVYLAEFGSIRFILAATSTIFGISQEEKISTDE
jgi:hypothetical protein